MDCGAHGSFSPIGAAERSSFSAAWSGRINSAPPFWQRATRRSTDPWQTGSGSRAGNGRSGGGGSRLPGGRMAEHEPGGGAAGQVPERVRPLAWPCPGNGARHGLLLPLDQASLAAPALAAGTGIGAGICVRPARRPVPRLPALSEKAAPAIRAVPPSGPFLQPARARAASGAVHCHLPRPRYLPLPLGAAAWRTRPPLCGHDTAHPIRPAEGRPRILRQPGNSGRTAGSPPVAIRPRLGRIFGRRPCVARSPGC